MRFITGSSIAAVITLLGFVLAFLPVFLAGYVSGLSFFYPKIAAVASLIIVLPYFVLGIYHIFVKVPFSEPAIMIVPASIVFLVSIFALFRSKSSVWSRQKKTFGKILVGISVALPAVLATLMLVTSFIRIGRRVFR